MELRVIKLKDNAVIPTRAHAGDAGLDLYGDEEDWQRRLHAAGGRIREAGGRSSGLAAIRRGDAAADAGDIGRASQNRDQARGAGTG